MHRPQSRRITHEWRRWAAPTWRLGRQPPSILDPLSSFSLHRSLARRSPWLDGALAKAARRRRLPFLQFFVSHAANLPAASRSVEAEQRLPSDISAFQLLSSLACPLAHRYLAAFPAMSLIPARSIQSFSFSRARHTSQVTRHWLRDSFSEFSQLPPARWKSPAI